MRRQLRIAICTIVALPILVALHSAGADGGYVGPYGMDIWEPSQSALIIYDTAHQTEQLIIQPQFQSQAEDFAWIVPLPGLPEVETVCEDLFLECYYLSAAVHIDRGDGLGCFREDGMVSPANREGDVIIHAEDVVGIHQAITVSAEDASALTDSLEIWGYLHGLNRDQVEAALAFYVEKEEPWYFVALRIDPSAPIYEAYWYGDLEPISFTFSTSHIIYPMRISRISAPQSSNVTLYVCADHRLTFPGARTDYANRISATELAAISQSYPCLGGLLPEGSFLTRLHKSFSLSEMDDDVHFTQAESDSEFCDIRYTALPFPELLLLALAGAARIGFRRSRRRA